MDLTSFFSYGDFRSLLRCFLSSCFSANISAMKSLSWILCMKYMHNSFCFPLHKVIVWRHFGYHAHLVLCFEIISSGLCAGLRQLYGLTFFWSQLAFQKGCFHEDCFTCYYVISYKKYIISSPLFFFVFSLSSFSPFFLRDVNSKTEVHE